MGYGVTDINILQRDIQIRWTGEYEDSVSHTNADGETFWYMTCGKDEAGECVGGSYAWISGARYYDIAVHPDPGNLDKDGAPFRIWIPFEVWDMEAEEGPQQIDITIYDRSQTMSPNDEVYAFNPNDRMYTHFIHKPYHESSLDNYLDESVLTWNLVWWETNWVLGDTIDFIYDLPIGSNDVFQFTPSEVLKSSNEKLIPIN